MFKIISLSFFIIILTQQQNNKKMETTDMSGIHVLIVFGGKHGEKTDIYAIPEVTTKDKLYLDLLENVHTDDLPVGGRVGLLVKAFFYISCAIGKEELENLMHEENEDNVPNWKECKNAYGKWVIHKVESFEYVNTTYSGQIAGVYSINLCGSKY